MSFAPCVLPEPKDRAKAGWIENGFERETDASVIQ